jgi:hypothetical protein
MLHLKQAIVLLKQVFYSRYVQPHKMVQRHFRSRNPYVPQPWDTALPFCKFRSNPTQGRRWSRSCPEVLRSMPTPLRHLSLSPRPVHWYRIHYGTLPQRCPLPELGQDLYPLAIRSSHQKEEGPKLAALTYRFLSSSIPLIQLSNKSSTMPKMQRKKSLAMA